MLIMIVDDIWDIWKKIYFIGINRYELHNKLQWEIVKLADKYKVKGKKEFIVSQIGRRGLIDVVWISSNNEPIVAFEIDSSRREKSIWKLLEIDAKERYWIYYGCYSNIELYTSQFDKDHLITVINFPYYKK